MFKYLKRLLGMEEKGLWPELLGKTFEEAEATILTERPDVKELIRISPGSFVTADIRPDRVWLVVDADGKVAEVPCVG